MPDIQMLEKQLLNSEFETAKALYEQLRNQGYSPYKIAAMIYRVGRLDGKKAQKAETTGVYKRLHELQQSIGIQKPTSTPEATVEGENDDE